MTSMWFLIGLGLAASLSPLLTYAKLYQLKEWRWDRLKEHLRMAGAGVLLSKPRLALATASLVAVDFFSLTWVFAAGLAALAAMGAAQAALRRQPVPTWTSKAKAAVGLALGIDLLLCLLASASHPLIGAAVLLLLPLFQPLTLWASVLLLKPVDRKLKRQIMGKASSLRRNDVGRAVIGIVGSVGKTTTKELIKHLLQDMDPLVTPDHVNTEMGVAQWLSKGLPGQPAEKPLVVEMGSYRRGEVATLCGIAQPTMAVITALGSDHLALFGSEEEIVKANGEILSSLPKGAPAFCAIDTEGGRLLARLSPREVTSVGVAADAAIRIDGLQETVHGLSFSIRGERYEVPLRGKHHALNATLAICVAESLGVPPPRVKELLKSFRPLPGTFNVRRASDVTLVDDTYNASRLSMLAALDWAGEHEARPRTLLTMGLLELGAEEDRIMEEIGRRAAGKVERVVFVSEPGKAAFERGFASPVETLSGKAERVPAGSLLLCVGRIPESAITKLLP